MAKIPPRIIATKETTGIFKSKWFDNERDAKFFQDFYGEGALYYSEDEDPLVRTMFWRRVDEEKKSENWVDKYRWVVLYYVNVPKLSSDRKSPTDKLIEESEIWKMK